MNCNNCGHETDDLEQTHGLCSVCAHDLLEEVHREFDDLPDDVGFLEDLLDADTSEETEEQVDAIVNCIDRVREFFRDYRYMP